MPFLVFLPCLVSFLLLHPADSAPKHGLQIEGPDQIFPHQTGRSDGSEGLVLVDEVDREPRHARADVEDLRNGRQERNEQSYFQQRRKSVADPLDEWHLEQPSDYRDEEEKQSGAIMRSNEAQYFEEPGLAQKRSGSNDQPYMSPDSQDSFMQKYLAPLQNQVAYPAAPFGHEQRSQVRQQYQEPSPFVKNTPPVPPTQPRPTVTTTRSNRTQPEQTLVLGPEIRDALREIGIGVAVLLALGTFCFCLTGLAFLVLMVSWITWICTDKRRGEEGSFSHRNQMWKTAPGANLHPPEQTVKGAGPFPGRGGLADSINDGKTTPQVLKPLHRKSLLTEDMTDTEAMWEAAEGGAEEAAYEL